MGLLIRGPIWAAGIATVPIQFGQDGVPFYVAGPYGDARSVVRTLEAAVREGDSRYVLPMG